MSRLRVAAAVVCALALLVVAVAGAGQQNVVVGPISAQAGKPFSGQVATFTHVGKEDSNRDETAVIDWGDGTAPSAGTVTPDPCEFCENTTSRVSGTHTYASAGNYTVKVTVDDPSSAPAQGSGAATVSASATPTPTPTPTPTAATPAPTPPPPPPGCVEKVSIGAVEAVIQNTYGTASPCWAEEKFSYKKGRQKKFGKRYTSRYPVYVNGVELRQGDSADYVDRIVIEPPTRRIYVRRSGGTTKEGVVEYVGLSDMPPGSPFNPNNPDPAFTYVALTGKGIPFDIEVPKPQGDGSLTLFEAPINAGQANIAGFPLVGEAQVRVDKDGRSETSFPVQLPQELGGTTSNVRLSADNTRGLHLETLENVRIGPTTILVPPGLGIVEFANLELTLQRGADGRLNLWHGYGEMRLPSPIPTEPITEITGPLIAEVGFTDGRLTQGGVQVGPFDPILVGAGIFLTKLGLGFADTPAGLRFDANDSIGLIGGGTFGGLPLIEMPEGNIAITFGKGDEPAMTVALDSGEVKLLGFAGGNGNVTLNSDLDFSFSGTYGFHLPAPADFIGWDGGVAGWIDPLASKFNFDAQGHGCLPYCTNARGTLSSTGIAVCGGIDLWLTTIEVGFGYVWGDTLPSVMAPSCDFGPYQTIKTRILAATPFTRLGTPALRQTTAPPGPTTNTRVITLSGKREAVTFAVRGVDRPPVVRLTIDDTGESVVTDQVGEDGLDGPFYVVRDAPANTTHIAIAGPPPGDYTFEPVGAQSAVARIDKAEVLLEPDIQIKRVRSAGPKGGLAEFVVPYLVDPLDFERYTFFEAGPGVHSVIKTVSGKQLISRRAAGARVGGRLRFTPAPGPPGRRKIKVLVESSGLPRAELTVGSYVAPAPLRPSRPRALRLRRRGNRLVVTFKPAARATQHRIDVALSDGRRLLFLRGRRARRLSVGGVDADTRGRVSVRGLEATNEAGPPAQARCCSQ